MKKFDLPSMDLKGLNLIEASAGTGKTFNITFLFLRLIVEAGLDVNQVAVVTFTEAATAELRSELRERLKEAGRALASRGESSDLMAEFVASLDGRVEEAGCRIERALRDFDQASVSTIHGFCKRILEENAFECGTPFSVELIGEQAPIYLDIARDYWARETYNAPSVLVEALNDAGVSPESLAGLIGTTTSQPDLEVLTDDNKWSIDEFRRAFAAAREIWLAGREVIGDLVSESPGLNRNKYRRGSLAGWIEKVDRYFSHDEPRAVPDRSQTNSKSRDAVVAFSLRRLADSTKKGHEPPEHRFFGAGQDLIEAGAWMDGEIMAFKKRLIDYAREELPARNERMGVQSFDDLLHRLDRALRGPFGDRLVREVATRFKGVLIDEFQDTDRVQYRIFKRLFGDGDVPLFLIGDPKQSIYAFRGGDIFTYLDAAGEPRTKTFTLDVNWRSDPGLVRAVGELFGRVEAPFIFKDIGFPAVSPRKDAKDRARLGDERLAPMQILFVRRDQRITTGGKITKAWAVPGVADLIARDIARLLQGDAIIEDRDRPEVVPRDIAVLVPQNRQALVVQDALREQGIASIRWSDDSVFQTGEAADLAQVMEGIALPSSSAKIKGALSTDLFGLGSRDLYDLDRDEPGWNAWVERFSGWRREWATRGFFRMMRSLLDFRRDEESISASSLLLIGPHGERRMTNWLHLAELLHGKSQEESLGILELSRWFEQQRATGGEFGDSAQIRLESDDDAVKIVTIHKSKGLQYPVVYLPYLWDGALRTQKSAEARFHDPALRNRPRYDLGTADLAERKLLARREEMAENLRLLYVALTRAQHLCKVVWGGFNSFGSSPLGYLLHNPGGGASLDEVFTHVGDLDDDAIAGQLRDLEIRSNGAICVCPLEGGEVSRPGPVSVGPPDLECRRFYGEMFRARYLSSFTGMISSNERLREDLTDGPDHSDFHPTDLEGIPAAGGMETHVGSKDALLHDFQASANAGSCLHYIFEQLDFTDAKGGALSGIVTTGLEKYGFGADDWKDPVCNAVGAVLDAPLGGEKSDIILRKVSMDRRLTELEFLLPVNEASSFDGARLADILSRNMKASLPEDYTERVADLGFGPLRGFFKGFIDLVFEHQGKWFLVDYKSNHLGDSVSDYSTTSLRRAMAQHHYYLQYHLYVAALHRYLRYRIHDYDYDKHFGGVFYLFIRGMTPRTGTRYGVFADRPSRKLVEKVSALFEEGSMMGVDP